ncbi:MAG: NAD-dependent deacetylase [Saprospiraceae bacterium]|nr:NAD-dependent deacetylase [Saprospiraceae bacterium]
MISDALLERIKEKLKGQRKISFLVGAGLSAESGIPTFRGKDGFWVSGSKNYQPEEIGTKAMFDVNAHAVWEWFLFRISMMRDSQPNAGHRALVEMQDLLGDRYALISQNVDGLHFKAGSDENCLFLIHGDLRYMRCSEECSKQLYPIPAEVADQERTRSTKLTFEELQLLVCPKCGEMARPHVLWFDEYYNQSYYRLHDVLRIAKETGLLFVVGTSGATNLPRAIVNNTLARQGIVVDINPNSNYFSEKLSSKKNGFWIQGKSGVVLPRVVEIMKEHL